MSKPGIAFIGPSSYYMAFSFLGWECFSAKNEDDALALAADLREKDFEIIIISRDIVEREIPGIVALPGIKETEGRDYLKETIKKAIGTEIKINK